MRALYHAIPNTRGTAAPSPARNSLHYVALKYPFLFLVGLLCLYAGLYQTICALWFPHKLTYRSGAPVEKRHMWHMRPLTVVGGIVLVLWAIGLFIKSLGY